MNHRPLRLALFCGVLIPFWLALGVYLAGLSYPGYSHIDQAMSELGAVGSPTHRLSPLINNFPLGLLFIVFGAALAAIFRQSKLAVLSALLVVCHGLGSVCTGYFSCDVGCGLENPSTRQQIHNLAGLIMFITLTLASGLWIYLARPLLGSRVFSWFSLICTFAAIVTVPLMSQAVEAHRLFGFYQRLNYGISVIWIGVLAGLLLARASTKSRNAVAAIENA